jgi:DNA-directed RNA polymerase subunit N (RpoN/RPB10)
MQPDYGLKPVLEIFFVKYFFSDVSLPHFAIRISPERNAVKRKQVKMFLAKLKTFFMNENEHEEFKFRCVHCGHRLKELYKNYSPTIQKLTECEKCGKVADKLIEFESLVIIIDLILLSTQAQRHVLYNTSCKNLYKILMVITLLESYCLWMETFERNRNEFTRENDAKDPLFMEKSYYLSNLQIILCK